MKKPLIILIIILTFFLQVTYVTAYEPTFTVNSENGTTIINGSVSLGDTSHPIAVTVTAYDETNELNYLNIIMTDLKGNASFRYDNQGKSMDYRFEFVVEELNISETVVLHDFHGTDYWTCFADNVSNALSTKDQSVAKTLIMNEKMELMLNTKRYDELGDQNRVYQRMINDFDQSKPYLSAEDVITAFEKAVTLCYLQENKITDILKKIYHEEEINNYFNIINQIPPSKSDGLTILDDMSEDVQQAVFEAVLSSQYEKSSELTDAFTKYVLLKTIYKAIHYNEVKTVIEAYYEKKIISVNMSKNTDGVKVYKKMIGNEYKSMGDVESAFNEIVKSEKSSGNNSSSGGSSSSGSSGSYSVDNSALKAVAEPLTISDKTNRANMYFNDMEDAKWALNEVNTLYENGIISGTGLGLFEPHRNITRAEIAKLLVAMKKIETTTVDLPFKDVSINAWYYPYVCAAYKSSVLIGIEPNIFGVNNNMTRQELAVALYRLLEDENIENNISDFCFNDENNIADWAKDAVYCLHSLGIVTGRSDKEFCPTEYVTRAETAVLLSRTYSRLTD